MTGKTAPLGICDHCGGPFPDGLSLYASHGNPRRYCSAAHKNQARRALVGTRRATEADLTTHETKATRMMVIYRLRLEGHLSGISDAELGEALAKLLPEDDQKKKPKWFPGAAQWLSNKLRRLAPALRTIGWEVDCDAFDGTGRRRAIEICKAKNAEPRPESAPQFQENCGATALMKEPQQPTLAANSAPQYTQFAPIPIFSSVTREVGGIEETKEERARSEKLQSKENCVNCDDSGAGPADELEVFEL